LDTTQVGQIPWLDKLLGKNPYCPIKFATFEHAAFYCVQRVMERAAARGTSSEKKAIGSGDFLDNFLEAKETNPDTVSDNEVVSYLMMNVLAGEDTTAIVMKSIVWYILSSSRDKNDSEASVKARLVAELDAANLSFPPKYEETRNLPYLNAVIREGMRMHPVISGILERVVPQSGPGLTLPDGRVVAPGTKVGLSAWVTSRNEEIFGPEPEEFNPDRWIKGLGESEDAFATRLRRMNGADMTFGAGNRICVGRNMANVEIHKLVSTLFSRYDVRTHIFFLCSSLLLES
jgi:cytochrome P450